MNPEKKKIMTRTIINEYQEGLSMNADHDKNWSEW